MPLPENAKVEKEKSEQATNLLEIEKQKSNITSCSNVSYVKGLMPKRIMSANRKNSKQTVKKVVVEKEEPKKCPKDRSALVGLKRNRKSRDQIQQLQKCYEDNKGKPTKLQLKQLSKDTGLKLQ